MSRQKRIVWVDYMRCIGLLLVIGAHVFGTSSPAIQLLFGCNVAIMIVVSGYCSVRSSECPILEYYKKRGLQLIIHPWIFFVIYFGLVGLLTIGKQFPYSKEQIIKTFLFMDGIGYTWIIAVFLVTALATPIIKYLVDKIPPIKWGGGAIAYWTMAFTIFVFQADHNLVKVFLYVSGYLFLTFIGFSVCIEKKMLKPYLIGGIIVIFCCIVVILFRQGDIFDISGNKFPPSVYYIAYGMTISLILIRLLSRIEDKLSSCRATKYITELSKQSFDIYLWHVFGLYVTKSISNDWMRFVMVIMVSVSGAWIYNEIKGRFYNRTRFV